MKDEFFQLLESVEQGAAIMNGELQSSRVRDMESGVQSWNWVVNG